MRTIPTSGLTFSERLSPLLCACYWLLIAARLSLSSLLQVPHTSKVATILSRCNSQCPLENVAHRIDIPKAAVSGNCFQAVSAFFQSPASCFNSQVFHKLFGRRLHFFG